MSCNGHDRRLEEEYGDVDENGDTITECNDDKGNDALIDGYHEEYDNDDGDGDDNEISGGNGSSRSRQNLSTNSQHHVEKRSPPSNEKLLCIAFVSFQCFAIVQMVVAWIAGSEAMIGDSFAMCVDAATYLLNWYAERQKGKYARELELIDIIDHHRGSYHDSPTMDPPEPAAEGMMASASTPCPLASLKYKKYTYQLELFTPFVTVSTLMLVIGVVMRQSIHVLILDAKRDVSEQDDPNVKLMLIFSILNLFLDMVNVFCFAQASHGLGYKTDVVEDDDDFGHADAHGGDDDGTGKADGSNLNMCSAWTHVFADTLRSLAVILAASLASTVSAITAEVADSAAAVVVSTIILLSLVPLLRGMVQTYYALQHVEKRLVRLALGGRGFSEEDDDGDDDDGQEEEVFGLVEMQSTMTSKARHVNDSCDDRQSLVQASTKKVNSAFV